MKYLLLISLFLLYAPYSRAQNCKYDYEKKDPFNGKMTKGNTATINKTWKLGFNRSDNDYTLGIFVNFYGVREDVIHVDDTLMLAIENAPPIILLSSAIVKPTSNVIGSQIQTWYQCQYKISESDLKRISGENLTALRIYFGSLYIGVDIPEKNALKIQKTATCILN